MGYIYFSEEQKKRANSVDLVDFLLRKGEKLLPSGRDRRLDSDHSVTVRGNEWYDHEIEKGGCSISFVQRFYGLSFPEAVTMLLNGEQGEGYKQSERKIKEPTKPFTLPPSNPDMCRVFAYLLKKRFLDPNVINIFAKAGLLYESLEYSDDRTKQYHNAIFVGKDENGIARHAHKKGIYTFGNSYRGNIESSDPRYSFHWKGTDDTLYVFEAPIDMLSYISLHQVGWQLHSYVALCGVGRQAMFQMLKESPDIQSIYLCLDHDVPGMKAAKRIKEELVEMGYQMVEEKRSIHKDWNEDCKATHGEPAQPAEDWMEEPEQEVKILKMA
ncbi:DUF3991 and toprim domain-containing protein [[Clostridium] symbiosum]|uniref:DUF3991 and toprim domain-containing protein n=1 Tax=Clostridium symbiosum TaxID=1512 RepID=UPI001D084818|nr:DUF3991 and toprim domain-containing protein [[Clostridium] symbiosum]MCB6607147.1 DUF3991 and toprim domain-containing protein [[Clostridium] symbiosum]MCB6929707.1 DUF3991 and toprim domain-containing protein [[Clostridium] symbiosum]